MTAKVEVPKKRRVEGLIGFGKAKDVVSGLIVSAGAVMTHSAYDDAMAHFDVAKVYAKGMAAHVQTRAKTIIGSEEERQISKEQITEMDVRKAVFQKTLNILGWSEDQYKTLMEDRNYIRAQKPEEPPKPESEAEEMKNVMTDFHRANERTKDNMKEAGKELLGLAEYIPAVAALAINPVLGFSIAVVVTGIKMIGHYREGKKLEAEAARRGGNYADKIMPFADKLVKLEELLDTKMQGIIEKYKGRENDAEFTAELDLIIRGAAAEVGLGVSESKAISNRIPKKETVQDKLANKVEAGSIKD